LVILSWAWGKGLATQPRRHKKAGGLSFLTKKLLTKGNSVPSHEELNREWTDQYVTVNPDVPELKRFAGIIGRVVTVNWNGKAVIDFQDGGWYDIAASADNLTKVPPAEAKAKFDAKANSAQPFPDKQS
jgi:hypothetical protein